MRIDDIIEDAPNSYFVNKQIDKKVWKRKGIGQTASVWQHANDPDTVVKVIGGGETKMTNAGDRNTAIAFYHFCKDHGRENTHLLRVLDINADDPEVVQIRLERLTPLKDHSLGVNLDDLADIVRRNIMRPNSLQVQSSIRHVSGVISRLLTPEIAEKNNVNDLVAAITMLVTLAPDYAAEHGLLKIALDLHEANWMQRADGTLVAVDPWIGY